MTTPHLANLIVHIGAGAVALVIGFTILARTKGTPRHRRLGRVFSYFTLIVCLSAATGNIFFRFLPLFAVLTVLVLYQLVSGWRVAQTKERGPSAVDALWTLLAAVALVALAPVVLGREVGARVVVGSALGGLGFVLLYDTVRWFFPRSWHRIAWRYEHTYKFLAALFGLLSAFVGNVVRVGQPWSQITPSAVGTITIFYFLYRLYREDSRKSVK
jgi:uncharacterized membrane protein